MDLPLNEAMETLMWTFSQIKGLNNGPGPGTSADNDLLLISISEKLHNLFNDRSGYSEQLDLFSQTGKDGT